MKPLSQLVRPNILALQPYSTARDEYAGGGIDVWLDANESPYDHGGDRSPPPPFFGAQQIYGTVLHGDKQQRQQRPVEVHLLPPFPQGKKDILHDVFRRLAVMDHLKSPCTQGFIVIAE